MMKFEWKELNIPKKNEKYIRMSYINGFHFLFCNSSIFIIEEDEKDLKSKPKPIKIPENILLPYEGFSMDAYTTQIEGKIFIYGGKTKTPGNKLICFDQKLYHEKKDFITEFNPLDNGSSYESFYHSSVIHGDNLYIFGGKNDKIIVKDYFYYYNIKNKEWNIPSLKSDELPPPRHSSSLNVCNNQLILFGGVSTSGILNDLWIYYIDQNIPYWHQIEVKSILKPPKLYSHSSFFHGHSLYVYGGITSHNSSEIFSNSYDCFYEYHSIMECWTKRLISNPIQFPMFYPGFCFSLSNEDMEVCIAGSRAEIKKTFFIGHLFDFKTIDTVENVKFYKMTVPSNKKLETTKKVENQVELIMNFIPTKYDRIFFIKNLNLVIKKFAPNEKSIYNQEKRIYQILNQKEHPNIMRDLSTIIPQPNNDKFKDNLCIYFEKMDYDLRELIKEKALSHEKKLNIIYQFLKGMEYLHSKNIVHLDLKPENIFVKAEEDDFRIKIGDFSISEILEKDSVKGTLNSSIGTSQINSPERDKNEFCKECDIWSCGFVLFFIIYERSPIQELGSKKSEYSSLIKTIDGKPIDEEFKVIQNFMIKCLQYHPKDRPTFQEMRQELKKYLKK